MKNKRLIIIIAAIAAPLIVLGATIGILFLLNAPTSNDTNTPEDTRSLTSKAEDALNDGNIDEAKQNFEAALVEAQNAGDQSQINYITQQLDYIETTPRPAEPTTPPTSEPTPATSTDIGDVEATIVNE